ncbi:MAG TPA: purine-nucleoside phosphorylase [Desulfobacterales bacterium]|nr:purine-nucleoside phosphorylase [Desulfobacterales bacterium]
MAPALYQKRVARAGIFLTRRLNTAPEIMLIMGSGQGTLPSDLTISNEIPYELIPGLPSATAPGHKGRLISGRISSREIIIFQGRLHYYEGYSFKEVALPVRLGAYLGCRTLLAANTAGGLSPELRVGGLMMIRDHLNFMGGNPLRGMNNEDWGPRFPDMSKAYDEQIISRALNHAARLGLEDFSTGIYAAIPGPSLETPAETRFLINCGAQAVGMSTVPEIIAARHAGMRAAAISIIANINDPDNPRPVIMAEVLSEVKRAQGNLLRLINELLPTI